MRKSNIKGSAILVTAALIWGLAFVAQNQLAHIPSFLINFLRSLISVVFLVVLFKIVNRKTKEPIFQKSKADLKISLFAGFVCGICLTVAINLQQFGISYYPKNAPVEAHSGFLTALYVIIVPIFSVFLKKKIPPIIWLSVFISLIGFYFLCITGGFNKIYKGDIFILICAFAFALQIIVVDKYVERVGGIRLSLLQFFFVTVFSGILSLIFEHDNIIWKDVLSSCLPIFYLGIMSSGVAYTLQIVGQKFCEPAIASISMCLESVFAAIGGFLIMGNALSLKEAFGCGLVFIAIIIAQLPEFFSSDSKKLKEDKNAE